MARVGGQGRGGAEDVPRAWGQAPLLVILLWPSPATRVALRGHRGRLDVSGSGPEGHAHEDRCVLQPARGRAALVAVALRLVGALGRLQLREFRVDGAQTPLTGHLLPPPYHPRALEATSGVFQLGEPSMDGVRQRRTSLAARMMGCGLAV